MNNKLDELYKNLPSKQIAVRKTNNNLIEFINHLNLASELNYCNIHADAEVIDGIKLYSRIQIKVLNYSDRNNIKTTKASVKPEVIAYLYNASKSNLKDFHYEETKFHANKNKIGNVTKLTINRSDLFSEKSKNAGEVKKYPWTFIIENGQGTKQESQNGGITFNNYKKESYNFVAVNDAEMFFLMEQVYRFIKAWESSFAPTLIYSALNSTDDIYREINNLNANAVI